MNSFVVVKSYDDNQLHLNDVATALVCKEDYVNDSTHNVRIDGCVGVVELLAERGNTKNQGGSKTVLKQGQILISGNVELHNKNELVLQLQIDSMLKSKISDIQLTLISYLKWGEECVSRLVGNFSFVLWDEKAQVIFGAVDHLGVRSLYFRLRNERLLCFSNRLKELVGVPGGESLDEKFAASYLLNWYQKPGQTAYRNISAVPAGCCVKVKKQKITVFRYWHPKIERSEYYKKTNTDSPEHELRELLFEAVRCRLLNRNNIGILFSGGLDSSAIICIADRLFRTPERKLNVFSKVLSDTHAMSAFDEKEYITALAIEKKIKVDFSIDVDYTTSRGLHEYYTSRYNIPLNPFPFLSRPMLKHAASSGCEYLLTGFGGDEAVSSYGHGSLAFLLKNNHWLDLINNIKLFCRVNDVSLIKTVKGHVLFPLMPDQMIKTYRKLRGRFQTTPIGNAFLLKTIVEQLYAARVVQYQGGYNSTLSIDPREAILDKCSSTYFRPFFDLNEYFWDIHRIHLLDPLLDIRLIKFMLSLHPREFLKDGWTRSVFRRALKGVLPDCILQRKGKIPFNVGVPFSSCIVESEDWVFDTLSKKESNAWEIIDRNLIKKYFAILKKNVKEGRGTEFNGMALEIGRCLNVAGFYQWNNV